MFGRKSARSGVPKLDRTEKSDVVKLEKLIDKATTSSKGEQSFVEIVAGFQNGSQGVAREGIRHIRKKMKAIDARYVLMSLKLADCILTSAPLTRSEASSGPGGKKFCEMILKLAVEHPETRIRSEATALIENWAETYSSDVAHMPYFQTTKVELMARQAQGLPPTAAAGGERQNRKSTSRAQSSNFANIAAHMVSSTPRTSTNRPPSESIDSMDSQSTLGTSSMISAMPAGGMWAGAQRPSNLAVPPESPPDTPPNLSDADTRLIRSARSMCEALHQMQGGDDEEIRNDIRSQARSTLENLRSRIATVASDTPSQESLLESLIAQADAVEAALNHFENTARSRSNTQDVSTAVTSSGLVDFDEDISTTNAPAPGAAATTLDDLFGFSGLISTAAPAPAPVTSTQNAAAPAVKSKADEILSMFTNSVAPITEEVSINEEDQDIETKDVSGTEQIIEEEDTIEKRNSKTVDSLPQPAANPQLPSILPSSPFDNELIRRKQDRPASTKDESNEQTAFFAASATTTESALGFSEFESMQTKNTESKVDDAFIPLGDDPFAATSNAAKSADFSAFAPSPAPSGDLADASIPESSVKPTDHVEPTQEVTEISAQVSQTEIEEASAPQQLDPTPPVEQSLLQQDPSSEEMSQPQVDTQFPAQPFPTVPTPKAQPELSFPQGDASSVPTAIEQPVIPQVEPTAIPPQPAMPTSLPAPPQPPEATVEQTVAFSENGQALFPPQPFLSQQSARQIELTDTDAHVESTTSLPHSLTEQVPQDESSGVYPPQPFVSMPTSEQSVSAPQVESTVLPPQPVMPATLPAPPQPPVSTIKRAVNPPIEQIEQPVPPPVEQTSVSAQHVMPAFEKTLPVEAETEQQKSEVDDAAFVPFAASPTAPVALQPTIPQVEQTIFSTQPSVPTTVPTPPRPPALSNTGEEQPFPPQPVMPAAKSTPAPIPAQQDDTAAFSAFANQPTPVVQNTSTPQVQVAAFPPQPVMPAAKSTPAPIPAQQEDTAAFSAFANQPTPVVQNTSTPQVQVAAFPPQPVMPAAKSTPAPIPAQQEDTAAFSAFANQPTPVVQNTSTPQVQVAAFPPQPVMPTTTPAQPNHEYAGSPSAVPPQVNKAAFPTQPVLPSTTPDYAGTPSVVPPQVNKVAFPPQPAMPSIKNLQVASDNDMPKPHGATLPLALQQQSIEPSQVSTIQHLSPNNAFPAPREPSVSAIVPNDDPFAEIEIGQGQPYVGLPASRQIPSLGAGSPASGMILNSAEVTSPGVVSLKRVDTASSVGSSTNSAGKAVSAPASAPAPAEPPKKKDPFSELFSW